MNRTRVQPAAVAAALALATGCLAQAGFRPRPLTVFSADERARLVPRPVERPEISPDGAHDEMRSPDGSLPAIGRQLLRSLAPVAVSLGMLTGGPVDFVQHLEAQIEDRPIARRRAPAGQRQNALAFVRTELFFGTATSDGAVTAEEFDRFLDDVVSPLFPEGLTVARADGRFKGANGAIVKEDGFVLTLLYPVDGQKASSRNIDAIRGEYIRQHRQESVLRIDDPFLVWVSF